jgi:Ni/Co efflux regulator RcnB
MKKYFYAAACVIALFLSTVAIAQERDQHQFNDHDRQAAQDWYSQHHKNAPKGLRDRDRLSTDEEARLEPGKPLDRELRKKAYDAPRDLRHQLPPAPAHHSYKTIGGHVVLVDSRTNVVRDVIHLHHQ